MQYEMIPPAGVLRGLGAGGKVFHVRAQTGTAMVDADSVASLVAAGWSETPTGGDSPLLLRNSAGVVTGFTDPATGTKYAALQLGGPPVLAGTIILANPTVDGNPLSAAATINTQTVSATMTGQQLLYGTVHRDDFGGMATSILTYPGEIIVPSGVRYGRFTSSVAFPAEAAGAANGIRWNRIVLGPYATPTHKGNSGGRPAVATAPSTLQTITGIYEVNAGDHYLTTAIQNCGSGLTLGVGTPANNWASNWFMAEFFY